MKSIVLFTFFGRTIVNVVGFVDAEIESPCYSITDLQYGNSKSVPYDLVVNNESNIFPMVPDSVHDNAKNDIIPT